LNHTRSPKHHPEPRRGTTAEESREAEANEDARHEFETEWGSTEMIIPTGKTDGNRLGDLRVMNRFQRPSVVFLHFLIVLAAWDFTELA